MSAFNKSPNLPERREWWVGCLGSCLICGTPLHFPAGEEKKALVTRGPIETLLFKYGLSQTMQQAHLIDDYVLDNAKRISEIVIKHLNLKVSGLWEPADGAKLMQYIQQSRNFLLPTCHDCNVLMTKTVSDITTMFYGVLDPDWFHDGKIPYTFLDKATTKMSNAKALQAIFVFFTLPKQEVHDLNLSDRVRNTLLNLARAARSRKIEEAKQYLGKFIRKKFGFRWYYGKIVNNNKEAGTGRHMLHVYYSDGDEEDIFLADIETHVVPRSSIPYRSVLAQLDKLQVQSIARNDDARGAGTQPPVSSTGADSGEEDKASTVAENGQTDADLTLVVGNTSAEEDGRQAERTTMRHTWQIKSKQQIFLDQCIVKTVSHLMQWGATKDGRHRAIAVFWSGYYLWLKFVDKEKDNMTEFRIWFTYTFREYYMHMFQQNTWFTHDALTIAQLTNLNASVHNNAGSQEELAMPWIKWAREQLGAFENDMTSLTDFVYDGKTDTLRDQSLKELLIRRDSVRDVLDNIREYVGNVEDFYDYIHKTNLDGLRLYFSWYEFCMRGTKNVQDNLIAFQTEAHRVLFRRAEAAANDNHPRRST